MEACVPLYLTVESQRRAAEKKAAVDEEMKRTPTEKNYERNKGKNSKITPLSARSPRELLALTRQVSVSALNGTNAIEGEREGLAMTLTSRTPNNRQRLLKRP